MTPAKQRRLLRELILEGKAADPDKAPKEQKPAKIEQEQPKNKLHLNIRKVLNILKRAKQAVFFFKKSKQQKISKEGAPETHLGDIWKIVKLIVSYGIVGGNIVFLAIMLLPLDLPPLSDWLKGSGILQILTVIFGAGCLIYLFFDLNLFVYELRNRGK